jgi:hypothetical protein
VLLNLLSSLIDFFPAIYFVLNYVGLGTEQLPTHKVLNVKLKTTPSLNSDNATCSKLR